MKRGERESGGACKSATPGPMDGQREARRYVQTSGTVSNPGSEARISEETFGNRGTRPWPPFRKRDFNQILPFHQFLLLLSPLLPLANTRMPVQKRRRRERILFSFIFFLSFPSTRRGESITQFTQLRSEVSRFRLVYSITRQAMISDSRLSLIRETLPERERERESLCFKGECGCSFKRREYEIY